ncbi:MAG: hypothetical protein RRA35_06660 [Desulfomonilia bacterium]|nr:hypothetical protein [Desulfomonilia bacterium]
MLLIEWLSLQDPRSTFSVEKPRLPGQEYPGLGGLKNMQALLFRFARSASKDAIVDIPEYYHAAVIYSRLYQDIYSRRYSFFSPVDAGNFQAMMRDLNDKPLADVSFAVAFDCLVDTKTGKKVQWKPSDQIYPISKTLKQYFVNEQYTDIVAKTAEKASYSIDWKKFEQVRTQGMIDEI